MEWFNSILVYGTFDYNGTIYPAYLDNSKFERGTQYSHRIIFPGYGSDYYCSDEELTLSFKPSCLLSNKKRRKLKKQIRRLRRFQSLHGDIAESLTPHQAINELRNHRKK